MKHIIILLILPLILSCSKDDDKKSDLVTVEYFIKNGVPDGEVSVNIPGERTTKNVMTGGSYYEKREVPKGEWYYLGYRTKVNVPDDFEMYVKFDGNIDKTITKASATWGYSFEISR